VILPSAVGNSDLRQYVSSCLAQRALGRNIRLWLVCLPEREVFNCFAKSEKTILSKRHLPVALRFKIPEGELLRIVV
jgi:hypothetical protein